MKSLIIIVLLVFTCLFPVPGSETEPERFIVEMTGADYRAYLQSGKPLDVLYCRDDRVYCLIEKKDLAALPKDKIQSLDKCSRPAGITHNQELAGNASGLYHSYAETEFLLHDLEERFPDLARVSSAGQSWEGRELYVIKISDNVQEEENEPNLFYVGCHHAREWISVEVPLLFAQHLLEAYAGSSEVQKIVNGAQIFIMPIQNPDGLEYSMHHYFYWRKNRRYNGDFTWGVDTNRNYGYQWGYSNEGSSPVPGSEIYRGPAPFSEPENIAVRDFLLAHPPAGSISYHNFSQVILFPWGYTAEFTPDDEEMRAIARRMHELIFAVNGRDYRYGTGSEILYVTNGSSDDWIYATFGTPSYTIELPNDSFLNGGFFTSEEEIARTFNEHLPAMMYFAGYIIDRFE